MNFAPLIKCLSPINFGVSGLKLTYFIYYSRLKGINEYDLVHAHFGNVGAFFAKFVSLGLFEGLPYMVSFHGYDLAPNQTEKNKKLYRQLFRSSKLFTVNSFYMRGILERIDKEINFRVKVLPMGVDISFFNKLNYPVKIVQNEVYSIIYVGRLVDLKGPDTAIEIVNRVVHDFGLNKIELTIIGNGPLQDNLETKVLEKGLTGHVRLLGGQDQSIVSAILSQGDLFVYTGRVQQVTNRAETQGLVLIEAQAMGLPVLAFDVGGVGESILNGETGILIPAGDVDEFARLLVILLNDSERRLKMGISARKFIKDNFDSAVLGKKLLDIYDEVLG
ncbi:MAG: glycosyltransferase family 4 protein [Cyclobacteriaceae bacterium]